MTLRRSLLLAITGLTAAALLVVSGTAVLALRAYLLSQTAVRGALADRVGRRMPYVIGLVVLLGALLIAVRCATAWPAPAS